MDIQKAEYMKVLAKIVITIFFIYLSYLLISNILTTWPTIDSENHPKNIDNSMVWIFCKVTFLHIWGIALNWLAYKHLPHILVIPLSVAVWGMASIQFVWMPAYFPGVILLWFGVNKWAAWLINISILLIPVFVAYRMDKKETPNAAKI